MLFRSTSLLSKILLSLFVGLAFHNIAISQKTIRGTVSDMETGEVLIGASVLEEGTTNGTVTNIDGFFLLHLLHDTASLVVKYTGYFPEKINIKGKRKLDVQLQSNVPNCIGGRSIPLSKGAVKKEMFDRTT